MILYMDTSSLVKLYVEEAGSSNVQTLVDKAKLVGTSLIAYAEARAAFARRFRESAYSQEDYNALLTDFEADWKHYLTIQPTKELVRWAGHYAEQYGLRGFDAVHLASATEMSRNLSAKIVFSCFDKRLQAASHGEGMIQPSAAFEPI